VTLAVVVALAGCGDAGSGNASTGKSGSGGGVDTPEPAAVSRSVSGCAAGSSALSGARVVAEADLDADGSTEEVRLTSAGTDCPNALFAEVADGFVWGSLPAAAPPLRTAFGVRLGEGSDLVVTRQEHPRGGFQMRVFARAGARLVELDRDNGESLVPFVATDVQEHPVSVDCDQDALVVTEAVAHDPPGVMAAWDVRRSTFTVADGKAAAQGSEEVADNLQAGQLERDFPELVDHAMFASCEKL